TRVIAPNVSALAQSAWDQSAWNPTPFEPPKPPPLAEGPLGGATADYPNNAIADTEDDRLYQTVRYNLEAYHFSLQNGDYTVTLKFCEPHYASPGKRVFHVYLQGKRVLENLDIFARVGQNRALDFRFDDVKVTNGWLEVRFTPVVEFPAIAAISIEGQGVVRRINCGGPAYKEYSADLPTRPTSASTFVPALDFYLDWATHEFGPKAGPRAAEILARVDCKLPRPSDWVDGPGGIRPDTRPWAEVAPEFAFVAELEALEPLVLGSGNLERFRYWIETFRYHRAMAKLNCTWGALIRAMERAKIGSGDVLRVEMARMYAFPIWYSLCREIDEVYQHLLATVSSSAELGTIANWEQHILPGLLKTGEELAELMGTALPPESFPARTYSGPPRLILPTKQSVLSIGEDLRFKVLVLSEQRPSEIWVRWRPFGSTGFAAVPVVHVARGVYQVSIPGSLIAGRDFEYFVEATFPGGKKVRFPETAPRLNQTVVHIGAGFGTPSR
ncbi:MAG: malectin, partial [Verrucomicrobiae bacterium]|nr:malectin [Verrucomicrobiae bacterium]